MKRGTIEHPKTLRLQCALGVERWQAVGILESLWHWAARYAIRGDIGRWTNQEIAAGIGFTGDADKLIESLINSGWLDVVEDTKIRLVIHDIADHADNSWRENLANAGLKFWNGKQARSGKSGRPKKKQEQKNLQIISKKTPKKLKENSKESPQPEPLSRAKASIQETDIPPQKTAAADSKNFWGAWVDVNRNRGRSDPATLGPDLSAAKQIFKAVGFDMARFKSLCNAFLDDKDPFLLKQGHALHYLAVNKYLNKQAVVAASRESAELREAQQWLADHGMEVKY